MQSGGTPPPQGVRLVYSAPGPRLKGLARAFSERLRPMNLGFYAVRVEGDFVKIEVDAGSVSAVRADVAAAMRFDVNVVADDEDDPFFGKEKALPFPTLVEKDTFRAKDPPRYAKAPREHDGPLLEALRGLKVPKDTRLSLTRRTPSDSFVRTYLLTEPSVAGGDCVRSAEATGADVAIALDETCRKALEKVAKESPAARLAFVDGGRVVSAQAVSAAFAEGAIRVPCGDPQDAKALAARFSPAALSAAVTEVREEKM